MQKKITLFLLSCVLILSACKKKEVDNETTSATDFARIQHEFMQIVMAVNERATNEKALGASTVTSFSLCPTDTLTGDTTHDTLNVFTNTTNLPTLTLNYNNCTGPDGKTRNGIITVSFTKKYNSNGCVAKISLTGYDVNGASCQGTATLTRSSSNTFDLAVTDGSFTGAKTTKLSGTMSVTLSDNATVFFSDDSIEFTGSVSGTNQDNRKYSAAISQALKKRADCAWISSGVTSLTPDGLHTRTVNFGNGNCDDIASFVLDSQTFTLHMSK
ncbi:MAG: hypothetical protein ACXVPN_16380 [Bacteroidia bacterium]